MTPTIRWKLLRLVVIAVAVTLCQLFLTPKIDAHVYGANAQLDKQMQVLLDGPVGVPHISHIHLITTAPQGCEGALGCTQQGVRWVYVDPNQTHKQLVLSFLHEIGHQWDFRAMDSLDRVDIESALGLTEPWWAWTDSPPGEVYAEAYAWCGYGVRPTAHSFTAYDYYPTLEQYNAVCAAILRSDDVRTK